MTSRLALLLLCCAALECQAEVSAPLIGYMRDRGGSLRALHGIAGAFVPGPVLESNVVAAAWSGTAGFAKTDRELLILDATGIVERRSAPAGPATFGFLPGGEPAWVRFADGSCGELLGRCPSVREARPPLRCRVPDGVIGVEPLGEGWLLARADDKLYAIRTRPETDEIYELPEPGQ
jgi:hypothetical protein